MTLTIKHKFASIVPDDGTSVVSVRPSNWNDIHDLTGVVDVVQGGTGQTLYGKGDLLAGTAAGALARVAAGADATVLTADSTQPNGLRWSSPSTGGGGLTIGVTPIAGGTSGRVLFDNAGILGEQSGGGGSSTGGNVALFSTFAAAAAADVPANVNTIQLSGYHSPGDNGGGTYVAVSGAPPTYYTGYGPIPQIPPTPELPWFVTGGVPTLVYSTLYGQFTADGVYGSTTREIVGGFLALVVIFDEGEGTGNPPLPSFTDTAGNIYTLAVSQAVTGASPPRFQTIYYCSNPVTALVGTKFNLSTIGGSATRVIHAYTVPGFAGAVLDKTAAQYQAGAAPGGVSLASPALLAAPELVIGIVNVGYNTVDAPNIDALGLAYTPPAGWINIAPPVASHNIVSCTAVNSTSPVVFNPTWSSGFAPTNTVVALATFKTFPRTTFSPVYWQLQPTYPLHTAQFGITPNTIDNAVPYEMFGNYLTTVAPPSGQIGSERFLAGRALGSVAISIANPAIITVQSPTFAQPSLRNGQRISFQTTGVLPAPLVPNQIYYVLYGTIVSVANPTPPNIPFVVAFKITSRALFMNVPGSNTASFATGAAGVAISTVGGSQSGTHSITVYDDDWVDFVLDPGRYWATGNMAPGIGWGLKKLRMHAWGAKAMSDMFFTVYSGNDQNSGAPSNLVYQTQFQTTNARTTGRNQNFVTLVTPANASHFYVNSWVALMALEMQQSDSGNWNEYYFEYQKIQSIDTGTGKITFYDKLQYNYKSTYPAYRALSGGNGPIGPGTIVQLNDAFDQEIEVHGLTIYGVNQQTAGQMLSLRFVNCDVWGFGFKTGPTPVLIRKFIMENCKFYNFVPEVDKMIDTIEYINCSFDETSYLFNQSSSINKYVVDRCRFMGGNSGFGGTAKDLTIRDSQIAGALQVGSVYGGTERMLLENCDIQSLQMQDGQGEALPQSQTTFTNGTIKIAAGTTTLFGTWQGATPPDICPAPFAVPGAKVLVTTDGSVTTNGLLIGMGLSAGPIMVFTVLDVRTNVGHDFLIDTTLRIFPNASVTITASVASGVMNVTALSPAGACLLKGMLVTGGTLPAGTTIISDLGIPNTSSNLGNYTLSNSVSFASTTLTASLSPATVLFLPHPCARVTTLNCTGGRWFADQAGAPPDIPMFSYFKRAFFGLVSVTTLDAKVFLTGKLISMTINVVTPYNGADAAFTLSIYTFGWAVSGSTIYPTWTKQAIDAKTAGTRTITSVGVSGNVGADAIAAIPYWITGQQVIILSNVAGVINAADNMANLPYVIVSAQTDQGINYATLSLNTQNTPQDEYAGSVTGATTS